MPALLLPIARRAMDARLTALELKRDLSHTWVCVDMDAFFAACEVLDRPDLADKPFAVGGGCALCSGRWVTAGRKGGGRGRSVCRMLDAGGPCTLSPPLSPPSPHPAWCQRGCFIPSLRHMPPFPAHRPPLHAPMHAPGMGMISTASYAARRFGVRSAMPGFIGRRLCPQLVFVRPDFEKYAAASRRTREVFK